jgi:hypothetical protein
MPPVLATRTGFTLEALKMVRDPHPFKSGGVVKAPPACQSTRIGSMISPSSSRRVPSRV